MIIKKILASVGVIFLFVTAATTYKYLSWRSEKILSLNSDSLVLETSTGPIEYRQWGHEGPAMLFLHGTPGGYDQYMPYSSPVRPAIKVISPSRPGYLRTPLQSGETLPEQADAYAALLDALGIEQVIVMGVSGGGPGAITFAARYPDRTLGLIAGQAVSQPIGPGCIDDNVIFMDRVMQSDFLSWIMLTISDWRPAMFVSTLIPDSDNRARVLNNPDQMARFNQLVESVQMPSMRQSGVVNDACNNHALDLPLSLVTSPALIIHGTQDDNVPYAFAQQLAAGISHAEFVTIDGGDHFITYTHPDEYYQVIDEFIARIAENTVIGNR